MPCSPCRPPLTHQGIKNRRHGSISLWSEMQTCGINPGIGPRTFLHTPGSRELCRSSLRPRPCVDAGYDSDQALWRSGGGEVQRACIRGGGGRRERRGIRESQGGQKGKGSLLLFPYSILSTIVPGPTRKGVLHYGKTRKASMYGC